jgi:hypothetical protein
MTDTNNKDGVYPTNNPAMTPENKLREEFDKAMCKYLDYLGMKDSASHNEMLKDTVEELRNIHQDVIEVMKSVGWGILNDGETFYKKGYELEPRLHFTFSMKQAYEIAKIVLNERTTAYTKGVEVGRVEERLDELAILGVHLDRQLYGYTNVSVYSLYKYIQDRVEHLKTNPRPDNKI